MKKLKILLTKSLSVPENKQKFLPSGYQQVGDIAIFSFHPEIRPYKKEIADFIMKRFPRFRTVCEKTGDVTGELRRPSVKVIAGENRTVTIHMENACRFKIDLSKVIFSQGNKEERIRLSKLVKPGETIIDMFAGIGYFSIQIAKHAKPGVIYAIDKNPDSIKLLKENMKMNCVQSRIEPILGDCRNIELSEKADRIIMGYLPYTHRFLGAAFKLLKPNGIIHYHDTFNRRELWHKAEETLKREAERAGFKLKSITYRTTVKHFAPNVDHILIDAEFEKAKI